VVDDDLMSEHSLVPANKSKRIVIGRSRGTTPAGQPQASWRRPVVAGGPGMTASPHRGPNRFLTLNMNAEAARGAAEVERQTKLLMEKMRAGSVPARPPPGSPLPKGYPGSPLRDRGKENRNLGRVQSSSPAKRTPQRPPKPLGNIQHSTVRGSIQQRPPLTPRCQPLNVASPVLAEAGLARPVLDTSVSTEVMHRGSEAARFITSTCARPQVARSRITPTHNLSVSIVKLKKSQLVAAGVSQPSGKERQGHEEEDTEIPDLFPALERTDSDNFYPTPPLYREQKKTTASSKGKKKHAEVDMGDPEQEEAPTPALQTKQRLVSAGDSDADLGFGLPPPKAVPPGPSAPVSITSGPVSKSPSSKPPSSTPSLKPAKKPTSKSAIEKGSESDNTGQVGEEGRFNFAKPTAPVSKPKKKKTDNVAAFEQNYLDLWMPLLKNNKLYLEGNKLDPTTGAYFEERWHTSRIMTRISERVVATKKGTRYVLEGGLRVRDSELLGSSPIPEFIMNNFAGGFPESWETLVVSWAAWLERQKSTTNTSSRNAGILFNSTPMLATPSQGPPSNMTLTSVSSMTGIEASRFLPANKTTVGGVSCIACPNCQTVLLPPTETPARAKPMATIEEEREVAENMRKSDEERELITGNGGVRKSPRVLQKKGVGRGRDQERPSEVVVDEKTKGREGSRSQEKSVSQGKVCYAETSEKQVEHRSRSKNVRVNRNSMTFMDTTMTKNDVTKLRAANYPCTVKDQGVKNYACLFCDFKVRRFGDLKEHISREHDRDAPEAAPTPKKQGRRSKSAETVREEDQEKRKTKGRRSISHTEGEEDVPACFKAVKIGSKTEYECTTCGGKVAHKSSIKGHCKSKKHLVAAASRGLKRKSEVRVSQSPHRKVARHQKTSIEDGKNVGKDPLPGNVNQKKASRSQEKHHGDTPKKANRPQEKTRGDTPKRTPGLKRFSCFVCDFSTDEEAAFRSHLVAPQHGRKVRQSVEDSTDDTGFLHCDLCNVNEGDKKAFIRHLESGKHVRREQLAAQSSKTSPAAEEVQAKNPSEENLEEPVSLKKQETVKGRPLNESRYGRKRKKNKAFARKSCVYTTPEFDEEDQGEEETPEEWKEKPKKMRKQEQVAVSNAKPDQTSKAKRNNEEPSLSQRTKNKKHNVSDSSLRRVVLDPARAKAVLPKAAPSLPPKPTKSTEEILAKMTTNPKTVKQRKANMEAMEEYNENHEDDLFGGASITAVKSKGNLFKPSSKTLLADSDSDDDQDVTLCSAKTPVTAYLDNKERRERLLDHMKTPAELVMQTLSPMLPRPTKFQQAAFVQKKLVEKKKEARLEKRARLTSALASKSKAQVMAEVDQSSRMISQLTQGSRPSQSSIPEEDDAEEWFEN